MKWFFPQNSTGTLNGLNHPGIEIFLGTPYKSLAREICQNSLDAAANDNPVYVEFQRRAVATSDIPDIDGLRKAFTQSMKFWKSEKVKITPAVDFFDEALCRANKQEIDILIVRDFYTRGLTGSQKPYNSAWSNLIKSSGVSDKMPTDGGSFGIGKYAPFACSFFRTVLYSTLDEESVMAGQGVIRLPSYENEKDVLCDGIGYFGVECNPLLEQLLIGGVKKRMAGAMGTDITILGFKCSGDWESEIIISVIDSFLDAIFRNKLRVKVQDVDINKDTLGSLIEKFKGRFSGSWFADEYYWILTSGETKWFTKEFFGEPEAVKLGLQIREGLHRRVAMVRKTGMKIMDRGRISGIIPFAGVMRIEGTEINRKLRLLENPQHDRWEHERGENPAQAKNLLKEISRLITSSLDELKGQETEESVDPGVGDYLPHQTDEELGKRTKEESLAMEIRQVEQTIVKKPLRRRKRSNLQDEGAEDIDIEKNGDMEEQEEVHSNVDDGGEGGCGDGHRDERHKQPSKKVSVDIKCARVMCQNCVKGEYVINLTPSQNMKSGWIYLNVVAETERYKAEIIKAYSDMRELVVDGNEIHGIDFIKNKKSQIQVILAYHDFCSLEVSAYGYKG